jgi:hypothetical protein
MPGKFRVACTAAMFILVIAGMALVFFSIPRPSPFPALPNPNGYDDFVKAGGSITGDVTATQGQDLQVLRDLVSSNTEPLRLVRHGLSCRCSFPTEIGLTNFSGVIGDLAKLKTVALLLRIAGQLAERDGRLADAAADYVDGVRFADESSRGGFIINLLVGHACEAITRIPLAKLIPRLDNAQARAVLIQLDNHDQARGAFDEILRNERRLMRHEILKDHNPLNWPVSWWQARYMLKRTEMMDNAVVAHQRLLMIELALRCYRFDHGTAPNGLSDLVPEYLHRVPQDPFTKQDLIYRVQGTNWVAYSVGTDQVDDGGKPAPRKFPAKGDLLYDPP